MGYHEGSAPANNSPGITRYGTIPKCVYHTRDEAKADVFFYIESFYNRRRRHSALDYLSPEAYEPPFYRQVLTFA